MGRHIAIVGILWVLLTIVGEVWAFTAQFQPPGYAKEAQLSDAAFQFMVVLGVPVFAFVMAVLGYAVVRFRSHSDTPQEDGPPLHGHRSFTVGWLAVTSSLTALVLIYPGITGMMELRHQHDPDLLVQVTGFRWAWRVVYPQYSIASTELVVPLGNRVQFDVTATDILHSFWVPGFRVKVDAVPGLVTTTHVTPTQLGSFETDEGLRIQCAELCGVAHGLMKMPVRVLGQDDFDKWVTEQVAKQ